ncbi:hypothetical protein AVEN_259313-1 [Araneus ventricosus]|uniref:Uncharacterized protein n=1 Tax=Araneus ventricosus TaxID=182803 RepID=A0A4Y2GKQ7_ARAVE|nr:hypothetical protein AVEN_259313-1 [Araneus ventricosus]
MKTLREAANQRARLFSMARIEVKVGYMLPGTNPLAERVFFLKSNLKASWKAYQLGFRKLRFPCFLLFLFETSSQEIHNRKTKAGTDNQHKKKERVDCRRVKPVREIPRWEPNQNFKISFLNSLNVSRTYSKRKSRRRWKAHPRRADGWPANSHFGRVEPFSPTVADGQAVCLQPERNSSENDADVERDGSTYWFTMELLK